MKEYNQGVKKEKSALEDFAVKYIIEGEPGIKPVDYFNSIYPTLEDFFKDNRNIKFNMVLTCLMENQVIKKDKGVVGLNEDKAYLNSGVRINLESTDVNKLIHRGVKKIIEYIDTYQVNGSGWYFKEVVELEIHTVKFNPAKGSSYIDLPQRINSHFIIF